MKRIAVLTVATALVIAGAALAEAGGPSATGGSHLVAHDVFGLQTLELQNFGFNARMKGDGSADGWFTYRDVEDGAPFSADGAVTCLTVLGADAWIGGVIRSSNDSTVEGPGGTSRTTARGRAARRTSPRSSGSALSPRRRRSATTILRIGSRSRSAAEASRFAPRT